MELKISNNSSRVSVASKNKETNHKVKTVSKQANQPFKIQQIQPLD